MMLAIIPAVVGSVVFYSLFLVALVRGSKNDRLERLFALVCFLGGLYNTNMFLVTVVARPDLALTIDRFINVIFIFSVPLYLQFTQVLLEIRRSWLESAAFAVTLMILPFTQSDYFITGHHQFSFGRIAEAGPLYYAFLFLAAGVVVYCLVLLLYSIGSAGNNDRRNRLKYIAWGFGGGTFLVFLSAIPVSGIPVYPPGNFSFVPAIVLAYGVLKYDILDLRVAVGRVIYYFLMTAILAVIFIVIGKIINYYFKISPSLNSIISSGLLALVTVIVFDPVKRNIRSLMDRYLFKGRYNYRIILKEVSVKMTSLLRIEEIGTYLVNSIYGTLKPSSVAMWVFDEKPDKLKLDRSRGSSSPCSEERWREGMEAAIEHIRETRLPLSRMTVDTNNLEMERSLKIKRFLLESGVDLMFPIVFKNRLSGILIVGEKKSGDLFSSEDMEILSIIANQAAVAVANALTCEGLEKMNVVLEEKVAQRTADLTRLIEEKERTMNRLIQSESLAAIGQLVAGTAHELNNPLAGASSLVESSLEALAESNCHCQRHADVLDDLAFSLKEMKRAGAIIRSLLSLSRQTDELMEPFNINDVINDALRILHSLYKNSDIQIRREFDVAIPCIEGNFAHLGQAFINIIKNALQSLPKQNGEIALSSRYLTEGDIVQVTCRDNGGGIASRQIGEVCKPFFTTKPVGEGTGLGLYITHEIIRKHDGVLYIESTEGLGTAVIIEIPAKGERHDESCDCG